MLFVRLIYQLFLLLWSLLFLERIVFRFQIIKDHSGVNVQMTTHIIPKIYFYEYYYLLVQNVPLCVRLQVLYMHGHSWEISSAQQYQFSLSNKTTLPFYSFFIKLLPKLNMNNSISVNCLSQLFFEHSMTIKISRIVSQLFIISINLGCQFYKQ